MLILSLKQLLISKLLWFRKPQNVFYNKCHPCIVPSTPLVNYFDEETSTRAFLFLTFNDFNSSVYDLALIGKNRDREKMQLVKCIAHELECGISFNAANKNKCRILYFDEREFDAQMIEKLKNENPQYIIIVSCEEKRNYYVFQHEIEVPTDDNYQLYVYDFDENPIAKRVKSRPKN